MKVTPRRGADPDVKKFFNGSFKESFNALVTSDGTTITLTVTNSVSGNLTMQFSDGNSILDLSSNGTIVLTAGTDNNPQKNYVYVLKSTKVLTLSTSDFPTAEHIKIGYFFVPSATYTQSDGVYINQNWNDHLTDNNLQGHMTHMAEVIRYGTGYYSGLEPNGTDQLAITSYFDYVSASESYYKSTSGTMYQMHKHGVEAADTRTTDIHVINWSGDAYHEIHTLNSIVADSAGGSLSNKFFNVFFFAVGNKTGAYTPLMALLPSGSYSSQVSAENDVDNYNNEIMPRQFSLESTTGVPICSMTLKYSGGTSTLTHISTRDLRQGGGTAGAGNAGSSDFVDNQFTISNVLDNTKIVIVDASSITTGNTRTITMADANVNLATIGTNTTAIGLNTTHRSSAGTDHSDVGLNNTHRTSTGADHGWLDQSVISGATPTFAGLTVNNYIKNTTHCTDVTIAHPFDYYALDTQLPILLTPAAITVTKLDVSTNTTAQQVLGDLKWASDLTSFTGATVINDFDTTSGVRTDNTITAGSVGAGKWLYLQFDSQPNTAITFMILHFEWDYD